MIGASLVAENVYVAKGRKQILDGATIRMDTGEITGLFGRNGSGKSTLLKSIFGVEQVQECDIFLNGNKISVPYSVPGLLNYMPQAAFLPHNISIQKLLEHFCIDPDKIYKVFPELGKNMAQNAASLSGGEERLWAALILILTPGKFAMLDELFTGVMPLYIPRLQEMLVQEKVRKGFIITDHRYKEVLPLCDNLYFMKEGKSFRLNDPADLIVHGYLNRIDQ